MYEEQYCDIGRYLFLNFTHNYMIKVLILKMFKMLYSKISVIRTSNIWAPPSIGQVTD